MCCGESFARWRPVCLPVDQLVPYLVSTVGGSPLSVIKQYIENQKRSERWTCAWYHHGAQCDGATTATMHLTRW
jgi:hypothetical protein